MYKKPTHLLNNAAIQELLMSSDSEDLDVDCKVLSRDNDNREAMLPEEH